jgi:RNA polymerase sigma factor (sigma-70 family)
MPDGDAAGEDRILSVVEPLRRYVRARVRDPHDVDDIVQEVLVRLVAARDRLTPDAATAYAIVVARHVLADQAAAAGRARRHHAKLIDRSEPQRPDLALLRAEERQALRSALEKLPEAQRVALLSHVVDDRPVSELAAETGTGSGSLSAKLARIRAQVRLDYVLALRGVELPTPRCRPVLLSLSAADRRRQATVRAGEHLLVCPTCAQISEPLLRRRSVLAVILPWLGLGPLLGWLRRVIRTSPGHAAGAAAATTVLVAVGAVAAVHAQSTQQPPPPPPAAPPAARPAAVPGEIVRRADGQVLVASVAALAGMRGDVVTRTDVPVTAVTADEGFWVGDGHGGLLWVALVNVRGESPPTVRAGERVTFTGTVTAHDRGFAARSGVTDREGARLLTGEGSHLAVDVHAIRIERG